MIHCKNVGIDWSSRPSEDLPLYAHRSANFILEGSQNVQGHQANFYQPQLKWNFVNIQNIPVFKPKPNDRKHASKGWLGQLWCDHMMGNSSFFKFKQGNQILTTFPGCPVLWKLFTVFIFTEECIACFSWVLDGRVFLCFKHCFFWDFWNTNNDYLNCTCDNSNWQSQTGEEKADMHFRKHFSWDSNGHISSNRFPPTGFPFKI